MKRFHLLMFLLSVFALRGYSADDYALIPMPLSMVDNGAGLQACDLRTVSSTDGVSEFNIELLDEILNRHFALGPLGRLAEGGDVDMSIDPSLGREAYSLAVDTAGIRIAGGDDAGVMYALMSFDQILTGAVAEVAAGEIPGVDIVDAPRYHFRALMLDPARNFLPATDVKRFVDLMARYKYNVLQLHLTDDEGWRVEIDGHPELTRSGSYYTRDELRDLVDYASKRHVEIVPEIDIPGHTVAVLASHPEFGCHIGDSVEVVVGKTHNMMLCAACEDVYGLYKDVIDELSEIFPSEYIHLGGDESAIASNWAKCERCASLMDSLGYEAPSQLMNYFFGKIFLNVRANGKRPILWCELDNIWPPANEFLFDYPDDVVLVTWRNGLTPKCMELTGESGHELIMAPGEHAYLDYPQYKGDLPEFNNWGMPITTLQKCYELDPEYGGSHGNVSGVMGTLWAEAMPDINRVTYMAFPRALALAEAAWSAMDRRDWKSFRTRLYPNLSRLMRDGVSFRVPFEIADGNE